MKLILKLLLVLTLTITSSCNAQKNKLSETTQSYFNKLPVLQDRVTDFENIFTSNQKENLTKIIKDFKAKTTNQIAIVSVKSIGEYENFDRFSQDLSDFNGVGQKGLDNGLTIVFSKNLRKIRISTGTGTEKILTDNMCQKILNELILPEFREGKYYQGIESGLNSLIKNWTK
ncbi:TPM domain-containing protein [Tenacibaculum sp. SZ-18]|uniref:TPM domain-containing protein n=1 Tax=Tenacibaculum sp. SZ-18 TaxID=754423 RepID=UPI0012FD0E4E|nr:TPM domain-containing protein [Tenacibaculum sp. SZ-18]